MSIAVHCDHCGKDMKVKDTLEGQRGLCPFCNSAIQVPFAASDFKEEPEPEFPPPEPEVIPPTVKQLNFARDLGISVPPNISRHDLSELIDKALDEQAPIQELVQKRYHKQLSEAGFITYEATETQLLKALYELNPYFFIFKFKDDESRYDEKKPMQGDLLWTEGLNEDDVRYAIMMLNKEWNKKFDIDKYQDEFDGVLPKFKYNA